MKNDINKIEKCNIAEHLLNLRWPIINLENTISNEIDFFENENNIIIFSSYFFSTFDIFDCEKNINSLDILNYYNINYEFFLKESFNLIAFSTERIEILKKISKNLNLKFPIFSDYKYNIKTALNIPISITKGIAYYKNFSISVVNGKIQNVYYPYKLIDKKL